LQTEQQKTSCYKITACDSKLLRYLTW